MINLLSFKIFESQAGDNFRFPLPLPVDQNELTKINSLPGFKTLSEIFNKKFFPKFQFNKSGSLELHFLYIDNWIYPFKLTKSGKLVYGAYSVGPTTRFKIKNWNELIDFICVYVISKKIGVGVNQIDSFVFDGVQMPTSVASKLNKGPLLNIIIDIAKKYNSPSVIDELLGKILKKSDEYISDAKMVEETEIYKFLEPIFDLKSQIEPHDNSITITFNYKSPYGILDKFTDIRIWGMYLSVGADGEVKVKTQKGLENATRSKFLKTIYDSYSKNPLILLRNKMISFLIENTGITISKDIILEKFKKDIDHYVKLYLELIISKYSPGVSDRSKIIEQLKNTEKLIKLTNKDFKGDKIASIISDVVKEDPTILSKIKELDKDLYDEIIKELGWDKIGKELLDQIISGLL